MKMIAFAFNKILNSLFIHSFQWRRRGIFRYFLRKGIFGFGFARKSDLMQLSSVKEIPKPC